MCIAAVCIAAAVVGCVVVLVAVVWLGGVSDDEERRVTSDGWRVGEQGSAGGGGTKRVGMRGGWRIGSLCWKRRTGVVPCSAVSLVRKYAHGIKGTQGGVWGIEEKDRV